MWNFQRESVQVALLIFVSKVKRHELFANSLHSSVYCNNMQKKNIRLELRPDWQCLQDFFDNGYFEFTLEMISTSQVFGIKWEIIQLTAFEAKCSFVFVHLHYIFACCENDKSKNKMKKNQGFSWINSIAFRF